MSGRSALLVLVLVLAAAASGWLLLRGPDPSPEERLDRPRVEAPRPSTDAPPPSRTEPAPSEPPEAPSAAEPVAPPPVEAPKRVLAPEQLQLPSVRLEDTPALDVLNDVARQAGFELVIPGNVRTILENARVNLQLENTTGAIVIALVLQPYGLNYTVRDGTVRLLVDDD